MKGTIFNIQRFSLHDGPGIRTTVFFKGCPLRCSWCHNPESFEQDTQIVFNKEKCIYCGLCRDNHNETTSKICPTGAIETVGYEISVEDLMIEITKDVEYYKTSGGGVTISGGEPFYQSEFLEALLRECKNSGIHTTIDTSGYTSRKGIENLLGHTDLFLYDIKFINNELHKKYTGASNKHLLENLKFISTQNKRIFIRLPLIPKITDTDENINNIIEFLNEIEFEQINLLSYHKYALNKYIKLGMKMNFVDNTDPLDRTSEISKKFEAAGFKTVTGG